MKKLTIFALLIALVASSFLPAVEANALSGSSFKPGRIMDDQIFYNGSGMNITQIQNFLNSKVPDCDRYGEKPYGNTTRRAYSKARGIKFPLTCLKNYKENPTTKANNLEGRRAPSGSKSAARIIWEAGQTFGINPKVIITLLQKEQSLVSDDWPWPIQYRAATGYGCPDTAGCNSQYYGFYNQVRNAARQFKNYADNPNNYNHVPGQNNYIRWSPNASCGGSTVFITNQATASLYNYTPYRPNKAALDNLYGSGNSCSAYGNRNFWRIFNEWFGSPYAPVYKARLYGRSSSFAIKPGQSKRVFIAYRNVGTSTWYDSAGAPDGVSPTVLAATKKLYRKSKFNGQFDRVSRPKVVFSTVYNSNGTTESVNQHRVLPKQIAKYEFQITAPMELAGGKTYKEWFEPLVQPKRLMNGKTPIKVKVPRLTKTSTVVAKSSLRGGRPGQELSTFVKIKNTGNITWYDKTAAREGVAPVVLSTANPTARLSKFGRNYENLRRPTSVLSKVYKPGGVLSDNQHIVRPGETALFRFTMTVPSFSPGTYSEWLGLRFAGSGLKVGKNIEFKVKVLRSN